MIVVEFETRIKDGKIEVPEQYSEQLPEQVRVMVRVEGDSASRDEEVPNIGDKAPGPDPLERFLALQGVLRDNEAFDQAMEELDQAWSAWTATPSASIRDSSSPF